MTKVLITESSLQDIADAIRAKNGGSTTYKPGQMAAAIGALPDVPTLVSKTITGNGTYDPEDDDADGYSGVSVNVPNSYASVDEGKVVSNGALVAQTAHATVTENGTIDTTLNNSVTVNVSGGGGLPLATKVGSLHDGWYLSTNGTLYIDSTDPDSVVDVFSVQAGHSYVFCYGSNAGNRGTVAFTTTNIYTNPQNNFAMTLLFQIQSTERAAYYSRTIFNVSQNGYVCAYIGINIGQNVSAYLIDITNLA